MFKRTKICTGVLIALGGPALLGVNSAVAQEQQRIEITGTRIKTVGTVSSSPITSITAEELNSSAPVMVEEVIRSLPAAIPAMGQNMNNGSTGFATIDLRNLGTSRTLVLVNGRRMTPATTTGVVDTNSIPVSLLERVDLITGGASAVYGADAVAGVVNFVLRRNFEGVDVSTTYGVTEEGDGKRRRVDMTIGGNFADGRGNAVISVGRTQTDEVLQGNRPWGLVSRGITTGNAEGSATAVPAVFNSAALGGARVIDTTTGGFIPYVASRDGFNFNPQNFYVTPMDRTQVTALASYRLNDFAEVYADVFHTKGAVTLNLASTGTFLNALAINIGNPFIPDLARQQICTGFNIPAAECVQSSDPANPGRQVTIAIGRRITEVGPRINERDNTSSQWTAGVRGTLPFLADWGYEAYLQSGSTAQTSTNINWGFLSRVRQALIAVQGPEGRPVCVTTTNNCVPLNVFGAEGSITPEMGRFFNLNASARTLTSQRVANASINGEVPFLKSPLARSGVSLALGLEQREATAATRSDAAFQVQGEVLGTGAPTPDRNGTIKLTEGFVEAFVPLANGLPFVHSANLDLGFRETKFTTVAGSKSYGTWKAGFDYSPMAGLRLRAMQQRATRAPNVNELYGPVVTGLTGLPSDPCQGANINVAQFNTPGTLSNLCRLTGVPAAAAGLVPAPSAGQANVTSGGNPALGPEEADTTTIGLVFEPAALPGLSLTVDYYKIKLQKSIGSLSAGAVLNGCYSATANPNFEFNDFCRAIGRESLNGSFNGSEAKGPIVTLTNLTGERVTEGYDLGASYRLRTSSLGTFDIGFLGTVYDKDPGCVGFYGTTCEPLHKTKWSQRTTWRMGDFTVGYLWQHLSSLRIQPFLEAAVFPAYRSVPAYNYFDVNASWQATKNLRVAGVVNNIANKKPPEIGNSLGSNWNSGNTMPSWYDAVGRRYSVTLQMKF
jgi:iron complex outermembrane receptor protein